MVRIPVESEENRVVRPPRQACHRKGSGANRFNRHDRLRPAQRRTHGKKAAASGERTSDGRSTVRFRSTRRQNNVMQPHQEAVGSPGIQQEVEQPVRRIEGGDMTLGRQRNAEAKAAAPERQPTFPGARLSSALIGRYI